MRARSVVLASVLATSVLLATNAALSTPNIWARAREPRLVKAERTLVRLERVYDGVEQAATDADLQQDFRRGTLLIAEMSGASELGDARVNLLVAQALLGFEGERDPEIHALVDRSRALLGADQGWVEAELSAVDALAARSSPTEALPKLGRALQSSFWPGLRAELLRRRADARMALLDLRGSARDARAAQAAAPSAGEKILGCFALALALERSGDQRAAFAELRVARLLSTSVQAAEVAAAGVAESFVFRPADAQYLAALRAMEVAESADDNERRLEHYERASNAWAEYLRSAPPEDRWLGLARARQKRCELAQRSLREAAR